jgi:hypothetical protein
VREIDDADVRGDVADHGLDDTDELVGRSEVGQERHGVEAGHRADATHDRDRADTPVPALAAHRRRPRTARSPIRAARGT